jgi:hypothetical protein
MDRLNEPQGEVHQMFYTAIRFRPVVPGRIVEGMDLQEERVMQNVRGGCLCGQLKFEYSPPALWCAHCHCTLCQRAHGAPLVTWVGVSAERFRLTREETLNWYHSSGDSERGFCAHCGSTLFFRSERWPGQVHIVRSNIADEIDIQPAAHVYWDSLAKWFDFEDELPRQ